MLGAGLLLQEIYRSTGSWRWLDTMSQWTSALGTSGLSVGIAGLDLFWLGKLVLMLLMWMGRLEIIAVLMLF